MTPKQITVRRKKEIKWTFCWSALKVQAVRCTMGNMDAKTFDIALFHSSIIRLKLRTEEMHGCENSIIYDGNRIVLCSIFLHILDAALRPLAQFSMLAQSYASCVQRWTVSARIGWNQLKLIPKPELLLSHVCWEYWWRTFRFLILIKLPPGQKIAHQLIAAVRAFLE